MVKLNRIALVFIITLIFAAIGCGSDSAGGSGADFDPTLYYTKSEIDQMLSPRSLRIYACDMVNVNASPQLVVWIYPDDTAVEDMYGDGRYGSLIAQAIVSLDPAYGEGAAMVCHVGTDEPKKLNDGYYASIAFLDLNSNGYPDTDEMYAVKDINISGETSFTFDDPDFTQKF